jgi:hypothetical protein
MNDYSPTSINYYGVTASPFTGPVKSPTAVAAPVVRLMLYNFVALPIVSRAKINSQNFFLLVTLIVD